MVKRVNRSDAADEHEIAKIKAKHDKQISRLYSQDEWIFAGMAYIGPLFIFPMVMRQTSAFCQYHARQGMLLFGSEFVFMLGSFLPIFGVIFKLATLAIFLVGLGLGVRAVVNEKQEPLPVIGKYAETQI